MPNFLFSVKKGGSDTPDLFGRKKIVVSYTSVDRSNLLKILEKAFTVHKENKEQIEYLWNYYRGEQPILKREKKVRPEICNKIVENRANEIVSFKVGYLCGEPIQYVSRSSNEIITNAVKKLNDMMYADSKAAKDRNVVEWQMICGTAYKLVLPFKKHGRIFKTYSLDPRWNFVVYSNDIEEEPIMAVKYREDENGDLLYSVYTENRYFLTDGKAILTEEPHTLGSIPIIEYPANTARLGAFELVISLLDALNTVESNRIDGVEQFIQSFLKFVNCEVDKEKLESLRELGAILIKSVDGLNGDVDSVTTELNQTQTQTLKDDLYQAVLTICGMPNRNGGSSTSDTGQAVVLRDGWTLAESRAKDSETMFKESEQKLLEIILDICRTSSDIELDVTDIEMKFTRRNYENIQSKSQVLCSMLQQEKIHPQLAFTHCGMFSDPESAYAMSKQYYEAQSAKEPVDDTLSGKT